MYQVFTLVSAYFAPSPLYILQTQFLNNKQKNHLCTISTIKEHLERGGLLPLNLRSITPD